MTVELVFRTICVLLIIGTLLAFWFTGIWWGLGALVVSVGIVVALLLLNWKVERRFDELFHP